MSAKSEGNWCPNKPCDGGGACRWRCPVTRLRPTLNREARGRKSGGRASLPPCRAWDRVRKENEEKTSKRKNSGSAAHANLAPLLDNFLFT